MSVRKIQFENQQPVKVVKWKVEVGQIVYDGRVLLLYEGDKSGSTKLKSKYVGTVTNLIAKEGEVLNPGDDLFEIAEGCSHPTVINDLCAECGADLREDGSTESNATVPMVHHIPHLKVSHEVAQKLGKADTERLLSDRKLVLLVDLDQTLIHTTHDNIPNNLKDVHHFQLCGSASWYHTRLRPGTARFLKEMSAIFELHICTFGVRPYAHTVAGILDRDGSLFSTRILSRDECLHHNSKVTNLQALFPSGVELVCIIDDRQDVWNYSPNLIPVKPYCFFQSTGDINDPNLPSVFKHSDFFAKGVKLKTNDPSDGEQEFIDVEDEDDYLLYLESILKSVHSTFYEIYDRKCKGEGDADEKAEVSWVLDKLRGSVLKGCEIVFSGLVPLGQAREESEPYLVAQNLGATISNDLTPNTTHLVAANGKTLKVRSAKKDNKIHIVNPFWLSTCLYRWERVDERLYPLAEKVVDNKTAPPSEPISLTLDDVMSMREEVDAEFPSSESSDASGKEPSKEDQSKEKPEDQGLTLEELERGMEDKEPEDPGEGPSSSIAHSVSSILNNFKIPKKPKTDVMKHFKATRKAAREALNSFSVPKASLRTHRSNGAKKSVQWRSNLTQVKMLEDDIEEGVSRKRKRTVPSNENESSGMSEKEAEEMRETLRRRRSEQVIMAKLDAIEAREKREQEEHNYKMSKMQDEWNMKRVRHTMKLDLLKMEFAVLKNKLDSARQPNGELPAQEPFT